MSRFYRGCNPALDWYNRPVWSLTSAKHGLSVMIRRWNEVLLLLLFAGIVWYQLFIPPFIGMADNADFKRVTGMFCLGPRDSTYHYYGFFVSALVFAPKFCYYTDQVPSSEWLFTYVAVKLHRLAGGGQNFDLRAVAAVKAVLFIAGFLFFLLALRPRGRLCQSLLGLLGLWMFTDVLYVAYLNSFYFDSAALLGACAAVPLAVLILTSTPPPPVPLLVLFTASISVFGFSKAQHALTAWIGSLVLLIAARYLPWPKRAVPIACAVLPLVATLYTLRSTYIGLRGQATFNVVMLRLLPHSSSPTQMAAEFQLRPQEMKLIGKHAFSPDNPPIDFGDFYHRVFPRLAKWYMLHPTETAYWLYNDLRHSAPRLRFNGGGNFHIEDGKPFGALSYRFAWWSNYKAATLHRYPLALPIWYGIVVAAALSILLCRTSTVQLINVTSVLLAIVVIAMVEYVSASLLDSTEIDRHMFLFHAFTDFSVVFVGAGVVASIAKLAKEPISLESLRTRFMRWRTRLVLSTVGLTLLSITGVLYTASHRRGPWLARIRDFGGPGRSGAFIYDPKTGKAQTALSNSDGTYRYLSGTFPSSFDVLRAADFNGDGKADILVSNSQSGAIFVGMNKGDGDFAFHPLVPRPGFDFLEIGDLDGDARPDFALYDNAAETLYTGVNSGDGTFKYKSTLMRKSFTCMRLADFDGDGKADLFVYNGNSGTALIGLGDGYGDFIFHPLFVSPGYDFVEVGAISGVPKMGLMLYNSAKGTAATGVSDGSEGMTFVPFLVSPGFTSISLCDFTGHGKADLIVYNKNSGVSYFGSGTGTGTFNFKPLSLEQGFDNILAQDVNSDKRCDIILYNRASGNVVTGISDGVGEFRLVRSYWGAGKILAR